ncbi:MAG: hypothetical protein Q4D62_00435 [Planctomycetia bacterium]|nr:hypothetical protein [Planctomycetia bacterium]
MQRFYLGICFLICLAGMTLTGCKTFRPKEEPPQTVESFLSQPRPGENLRMK